MNYAIIITGAFVIGLAVNVTIGPVNLFCLRRAMRYGFLSGAVAGIGATIADGLYAVAAAFSISIISDIIQERSLMLQFIVSALLVGYGLSTVFNRDPVVENDEEIRGYGTVGFISGAIKAFMMAIANPGALLWFAAGFSLLKPFQGSISPEYNAFILASSAICGNYAWWIAISMFSTHARKRFSAGMLAQISVYLGVLLVIIGTGMAALGIYKLPADVWKIF